MHKAGRFGKAVYFTTLKPQEHTKTEIAKNNYNNGYLKGIIEGKVDCYIEIEIQDGDVNPFYKCPAQGREIYIVRGQLWLRNFSWRCGRIEEFCPWGPDGPSYCASVEIGCGVCGLTFSDSNGNYERAENMRNSHMEEHRQQTREVDRQSSGLYSSSSSGTETGCQRSGLDSSSSSGTERSGLDSSSSSGTETGCQRSGLDSSSSSGTERSGLYSSSSSGTETGCQRSGLYSTSSSGTETGCRVCGMIFSDYNGNYRWLEKMKRMHMKLHEPKNIPCPIARDKCFKNPASALKHIESGACEGCKSSERARKLIYNFLKSKKVAQNLMNPQLEYDGGRGDDTVPDFPYRCNQCGKVFKNVSSLMQHQSDSKRCKDEFSRIGPMSLC